MKPTIPVTEADLREQVRDLAKLFGWKMYFTFNSFHSPRGFPDLVLCRPGGQGRVGGVIFAELKRETGQVKPQQEEWLQALRDAGQTVYVWRPSDIEEIARVLR